MLTTFILYLSMAMFGSLWVNKVVNSNLTVAPIKVWVKLSFPLLLLSILIGGRYDVGTDWPNYVEYYEWYQHYHLTLNNLIEFGSNLEPLFLALNKLCNFVGLSTSGYFTLIAYCVFILLLSSHKDKCYLFPFILFFFFGQMFAMSMNIIRQAISISIFFFSLHYLDKSKIKIAAIILVAVLFHYSSIVLAFALLIDRKWFKILDNKKIVLASFIVTYIAGATLVPYIEHLLQMQYFSDKYVNNAGNLGQEMALGTGLGIITRKIVDVFLIVKSDKLKSYYGGNWIVNIFRLYFVGIILSNIMGISVYLSRLILGFELLRIFILAYYCYYAMVDKKSQETIFAVLLVLWSVLGTLMAVLHGDANCSPYQFLWQ